LNDLKLQTNKEREQMMMHINEMESHFMNEGAVMEQYDYILHVDPFTSHMD